MRIGRTLPPAASPIYFRDIISGLKGLIRRHRELNRFEAELKQYFGVRHCFLVSSGKAALTLILQALRNIHPDRDEVLIPAFTCYSVPSAIARAGLKVRLCDIDPNTLDFNFDRLSKILKQYSAKPPSKPSRANNPYPLPQAQRSSSLPREMPSIFHRGEALLQPDASSSRLLAIIPVHLFGLPADIARLRKIVNDPEITIIEDAAQTIGAKWDGKKLGTLGDISFFSLGRGKAISTVEGGIILTDRDDISDKIKIRMREVPNYSIFDMMTLVFNGIVLTLFSRPSLFWVPKSLPFLKLGDTIYDPHFKIRKLSVFQAGLAKGWVNKIRKFKKSRLRNSRQWASATKTNYLHHYCSENGTIPDLIRYPLRVDDEGIRARILSMSDRMGLGIMFTYPDSIDGIRDLKAEFGDRGFPVAKEHANKLITLPIHSLVSQRDRTQIAALILQVNKQKPMPAP